MRRVDGYNLYYGARGVCGRSTRGWRWLDLRAMAGDVIAQRSKWSDCVIENVTYGTARMSGSSNAEGHEGRVLRLGSCHPTPLASGLSYCQRRSSHVHVSGSPYA